MKLEKMQHERCIQIRHETVCIKSSVVMIQQNYL